ncbi:hypothetical protein IMSAGC001_03401 [Bacteroides acidifaciens]|uniref:Uncharacterized protein n=1 Tax=Bacteroides acidifaciens TaxID=85831 RepID=A0A7J0A713_9BACE|nr:hypothetical protein IMSAGC001_03401 [Bacteroides acidifaciens]
MSIADKILLRKRALIKTVNDGQLAMGSVVILEDLIQDNHILKI